MAAQSVLILTALLVTLVHAVTPTCNITVPFSKNLIGKSFTQPDDCYRPRSYFRLSVWKSMFIYVVREGPLYCPEKMMFHYRTPKETPFIVIMPNMAYDEPFATSSTTPIVDKWCAINQPKRKKVLMLTDSTRDEFISAVKRMIRAFEKIRDFGCKLDSTGFPRQIKGRAFVNADVEVIITYLHTVAFQHGFCVDN